MILFGLFKAEEYYVSFIRAKWLGLQKMLFADTTSRPFVTGGGTWQETVRTLIQATIVARFFVVVSRGW